MIFIVWNDYNGHYLEKFDNDEDDEAIEKAEIRIAEILANMESNDYGVSLDAVIDGRILEYKSIEVTKRVKLKYI